MELQGYIDEIRALGAELWALSPDDTERLSDFVRDEGLTFPVLIDSYDEVMSSYGLVNPAKPEVPHPTALIIDKAGVIRYMRVDEDYKVRPRPEDLIDALEEVIDD